MSALHDKATILLAQSGDGGILDGITPWLPDSVQSKLSDVGGMALAIGIIIGAVIGGIIVFASLSFSNRHGDATSSSGKIMAWLLGVVGMAILVPTVQVLLA